MSPVICAPILIRTSDIKQARYKVCASDKPVTYGKYNGMFIVIIIMHGMKFTQFTCHVDSSGHNPILGATYSHQVMP